MHYSRFNVTSPFYLRGCHVASTNFLERLRTKTMDRYGQWTNIAFFGVLADQESTPSGATHNDTDSDRVINTTVKVTQCDRK